MFTGKVLNVSAGENIDKEGRTYDQYFERADEFWMTNHSGGNRGFQNRSNEINVDLEKPIPSEYRLQYDVVFNHTTLEHIFNVFTAFQNICLFSKDIVILVVPFVQEEHFGDTYKDYWRFTPECIRELFNRNEFHVLYESCNNDFNTSVYLFFIASRVPEKWETIIPNKKIKNAGKWVGG